MYLLKKGIVDRFEGEYVVIEIDSKTVDIKKSEVDQDVQVNDVVIFSNNKWITDSEATLSRKKHIKKLMESVFED